MRKIDILLIWPNLKYNHWPSKSFWLMLKWLIENWYNVKCISWFNTSLINIIYIFFTKKIYVVSFPEKILYFLVYVFNKKKFIVWSDIEFNHEIISSLIYKKKNVLKLFNSYEKKYYISKYKYWFGNIPFLLWHWVKIDKNIYNKTNNYIVYYKCNNLNLSKKLENIKSKILLYLHTNNINYEYIEYWKYNFSDWIQLLKKSRKVIFITTTETYGLAKLEALSYNLPMLNYQLSTSYINWDKINYASTFSLFEEWFWEEFKNFEDFQTKFKTFNIKLYNPKKIVETKYSYIKKSNELYKLFNKIK